MTPLTRPVSRTVEQPGHRDLVVSLTPADNRNGVPACITFREKGTRMTIALPIGRAFSEAARRAAGIPLLKPRRKGGPR